MTLSRYRELTEREEGPRVESELAGKTATQAAVTAGGLVIRRE